MSVDVEIKTSWGGKLKKPERAKMAPLKTIAISLASAIRKRVAEKGESAEGGDFGQWHSKTATVPVFKRGRRRKGQTYPIKIGEKQKVYRVWIDTARGFPAPKNYERKAGTHYLVDYAQYQEDLHGDRKFRFLVSGESWRNLKLQITNAKMVRIGFAGAGPSLKQKGATVRNAIKMRMAQKRIGKQIILPSDTEIQAVIAAVAQLTENELAAIMGTPPEPMKTSKREHIVARQILGRNARL